MALNYYDLGNQMDTKLEAVQSELVKSIEDKSIQQLEKFEVALSNRFSHHVGLVQFTTALILHDYHTNVRMGWHEQANTTIGASHSRESPTHSYG